MKSSAVLLRVSCRYIRVW